MKKSSLLSLFVISFFVSAGQVVEKLHYNRYWQLTTRDSTHFYRVCVFDTVDQVFTGDVKDYTKNGKVIMTGHYFRGEKNGPFVTYFANGKKESEGAFEDNVRVGVWHYFYPNGSPKQEVSFGLGDTRVNYFKDSTGVMLMTNGSGAWREEYEEESSHIKIINHGSFNNYQKEGTWSSILENGTPWITMTYKEGRFTHGYMDIDGEKFELFGPIKNFMLLPYKHTATEQFARAKGITRVDYPFIRKLPWAEATHISKADDIYSVAEFSASPIGGLQAFYKATDALLKYPPAAKSKGIQGRVFLEFIINKDGSLSDIKVIKGIGGGCDEEAVRIVKASQAMVKWRPGVQKRNRVRQRYSLPINFKLS